MAGTRVEPIVQVFVAERFRAAVGKRTVTDDTPLFSSGIVDSFGVLELIAFLEGEFGVDVDPARHELEEFDTIRKIAALVARLRAEGPVR